MNCIYHDNKEASFICKKCEGTICKECAVNNNGEIICKECAEKKGLPLIKSEEMEENTKPVNSQTKKSETTINSSKNISSFWATVFSFLPGAGHMYLGLMKRGLQLSIAFFGLIAISNLFSAGYLFLFTVVIWFFNVFDCYHMRKRLQSGEGVDDEMVLDMDVKTINLHYLGIGLVVFGGLVLLNEMFLQFSNIFYNLGGTRVFYYLLRFLRNAMFPIALIVGGIWVLKKSNRNVTT